MTFRTEAIFQNGHLAPCQALPLREQQIVHLTIDAPDEPLQEALAAQNLPHDQWLQKFRAWAGSFPVREQLADDSRESIYP